VESGAALFLEKLITPDGFAAVFAALDSLATASSQDGFHGVMRRVGLQEVLQLECLSRKSSVLEIFTSQMRGRIFILDGSIIHAETGALQGEVALYGMLGLRGGEFNLQPFSEPARRTIEGHYEFLLMEAARLNDENIEAQRNAIPRTEQTPLSADPGEAGSTVAASHFRIEETLLCSGAGEVLYHQGCQNLDGRLVLLRETEQQGAQLGALLRCGRLERCDLLLPGGRMILQVQPHIRLLVRSAHVVPGAS
jgi:Domain of unknown function (DUF4388)